MREELTERVSKYGVKGFGLGLIILFSVAALFSSKSLFQNVNADEIVVIQSPVSGELVWHTTPGIKWQGFGRVTIYKKRDMYDFANKIRFNDGAHAEMHGSIQYELPVDAEHLNSIHARFGTQDAVQRQLVQTVVDKSIYMTGPLMSSKESYAEKRNSLIWFVEDQVSNGVYRTRQREERQKDPITGTEKSVTIVDIVTSKEGAPERQEDAVLAQFGIKPFNFSITSLPYEDVVEDQIKQQQKATMAVQLAVAELKQAEQQALTVAKQGEANAAEAKWKQETEKAREVTKAEQEKAVANLTAQKELEVATLGAKAAEQTKRKDILLGEGEAERRRLVMSADGALDKKLEAFVKVNQAYAEAIRDYKGNWVPGVVMGGNDKSSAAGSGATDFVQLMTVKAARELSIDLGVAGADKTK